MLRDSYRKLEPDTLVPGEQRQVPVSSGRPYDLDLARRLQSAKCGDEVSSDVCEQPAEPGETTSPELDQRQEVIVTRGG